MTRNAQEPFDALLARWTMGEADAIPTLESLCAGVARADVTCAIVRQPPGGPALIGTAKSLLEAALLTRVSEHCAKQRSLITSHDVRWDGLVSGHPLRTDIAWIASEPVADGDGHAHAEVIVVGWRDAACEDVLPSLPRLARAVAVILARERAEGVVAGMQHALNNLLASIVVNVDYASELLDDEGSAALAASRPGLAGASDLRQALKHARQSATEMSRRVADLAKLRRDARS